MPTNIDKFLARVTWRGAFLCWRWKLPRLQEWFEWQNRFANHRIFRRMMKARRSRGHA